MKHISSPPLAITIPLITPNEIDARLVSLNVKNGEYVKKDQIICALETTKSIQDITARADGYIAGLRYEVGDFTKVGEILCYLANSPDWQPPEPISFTKEKKVIEVKDRNSQIKMPEGLRITQPALKFALAHKINLNNLPTGKLITVNILKETLDKRKIVKLPTASKFDPSAILIYGGGGHGKSLIELVQSLGKYRLIGIIDDQLQAGTQIMNFLVLGGVDVLMEYYKQGVHLAANAVGGIGDIDARIKVFKYLKEANFICPPLVHPTAFIEQSALLSSGIQILPHAYIGSDTQIGFGVIVNTGAIISHDCIVEDYVNISPGAILAGEVMIGRGTLIGMGATINLKVKIGEKAKVGNSATIKSDVPAYGIVRAGTVWPT